LTSVERNNEFTFMTGTLLSAIGFCVSLMVAGLTMPREASAQAAPFSSTSRIRVTLDSPATLLGTFQSLDDSLLILSTRAAPLTIPLRSITRLEWSDRRKPNWLTGALGLVLGVGLGGVAGCAVNNDSYGVFCGGQDDTKVVAGAAIGGTLGAAAGALLFRREHWQPADLARLRNTQ
jgi:hypothetical protein